MTEFTNDFSKEIYETTYRYGDENINQTMLRIAKDLSSCEEDADYWCDEFLKALDNFKFVPGGRIISNAGLNLKGTTYINCYVSGFAGEDQDSMEGIMDALKRQALILKSEGGYGFCSDVMRPRGSFIHGIANESPGSVKMLEMWDTQSDVITAGSGKKTDRKDSKVKIRKGAQMVTKSCFSCYTEVLTDQGWMNIVKLIILVKKGEKIYALDDMGNKNLIVKPFVKEPEPIYEIETEDGEIIEVTADHQFEVKNIETNEVYLKAIKDIDPEKEFLKIIQK